MAAASWGSETGTILQGQYALLDKLGEHAGDVYRVKRRRDGRILIVRMWHADGAAAATAFVDIARAATRVRHPTLASVEACGREPDDTCFIVSEHVEGQGLDAWADKVGIPPLPLVIDLMRRLCLGLQAAQRAGLHHDALHPHNVRVLVFGEGPAQRIDPKLLDLGVASFVRPHVPHARAAQFMAPEQLAALLTTHSHTRKGADATMNVYSVGCLLYYLCTGGAPFQSTSVDDLRQAHAQGKLIPPSRINPQIPVQLDAVIMRAIAISPRERIADVGALGEALGAVDLSSSSAGSGVRPVVGASMPPMAASVFTDERALDHTPRSIVTRVPRARGATPIIDASDLVLLLKDGDAEQEVTLDDDEESQDVLIIEPQAHRRPPELPRDSLRARSMAPRSLRPPSPREVDKLTIAACACVGVLLAMQAWSASKETLLGALNEEPETSAPRATTARVPEPMPALEPPQPAAAPRAIEEAPRTTITHEPAPVAELATPEVEPTAEPRSRRSHARLDSRAPAPRPVRTPRELATAQDAGRPPIVVRPQPEAAGIGSEELPERARVVAAPQPAEELAASESSAPPTAAVDRPVRIAPAPAKPALPLRARVSIGDVLVRGSLPSALVRRAVERLRPALTDCYARAAVGANRNAFGSLSVEVDIDENARARGARAVGGALPGLDRCVANAVGKLVSQRAPDTGTVKATWKVVFEP